MVTTSECPHDDLEDDEDDKNAKTRETPIYIVSLKNCVSPCTYCTYLRQIIHILLAIVGCLFSGHFGYDSTTFAIYMWSWALLLI